MNPLLKACVALIQAVEGATIDDLRAARQELEGLPGFHPAGMIIRSMLADQAQRLANESRGEAQRLAQPREGV
ncbi:MAG: hypothetical protein WC986_14440 [Elusimicrobiota bacterium]|jgi:hypothetical protein